MQDLGTLGGLDSSAVVINNSGQVAGWTQTPDIDISYVNGPTITVPGLNHAFVWDSTHGMQDLGTLGGSNIQINAINETGLVVGSAQGTTGLYHAFVSSSIYSSSSTFGMVDLGTLGGTTSFAFDVNDSGQVVGTAQTASGDSHAFIWDSSHGMQDLGTLGGTFSEALAINNSGQVVGQATTASGVGHAFVWDSSHGMQDLGTLGGPYSEAEAINDSGQVSGFADSPSISIDPHAFLANLRANSPVFSALSRTIIYGTATTTMSGHLADGSLTPPAGETVSVTFNGVTQNAVLDNGGNFSTTFSTGSLQPGSSLTVSYFYAGDSSFGAANRTLSVTPPAPLRITPDNQTKVYGAPLPTLTASYSGFVNGDTPASLTTQPSLNTTATAFSDVGSYLITASGASDPDYAISYADGTMTITPDGTTTTVTSSLSSLSAGQQLTFTATVSAAAPGGGTPTGWVDFTDSATNTDLGLAYLSGGSASLTVSSLLEDSSLPGNVPHSIVATYKGSTDFLSSDSSAAPLTIVVTDVPPTVTVISQLPTDASNNPTAPVGTLVTFYGLFRDSPIENPAFLSAANAVSWAVTLNGQPYSLPTSVTTNGPTFSFTPTVVGNYVVNVTGTDPDGGSASAQQAIDITSMDVNPNPLQNLLNTEAISANNNIFDGFPPVTPVAVTVQADPTQINAAVNALNGVTQPQVFDQDTSYPYSVPVTVTLNLTSGNYQDVVLNLQPGVTVIVNGVNGSTTIVGHSPALTVLAGNVTVNNVAFTTATDAPTILVTGGSLALRDDVVPSSTGFSDAAIAISGGSLDLGTASSPGNNTINVNGNGQLVQNTTGNPIAATGNTFQVGGVPLTAATFSSTTLTSSANLTRLNQLVTLTAIVQSSGTPGTPTGKVTFVDATTNTTLGSVALSSGKATLTVSTLPVGHQTIQACYGGDATYLPSLDSVTQSVQYHFGGFLAPLHPNMAYAAGRTIPIKFQLTDYNGAAISSLSAVTSLQVLNGSGTDVLAGAGKTGLRSSANQFVYNWQTKGLANGTYTILLALNDGTTDSLTLTLSSSGAFQLADGASSGYVSSTANQVLYGALTVAVQDDTGAGIDQSELDRLNDALSYLNASLGSFGVNLTWATDATAADVHIHFASSTPQGGASDGVLGFTAADNDVYLVEGWNYSTAADPTQVGAGQFDFLTLATHELAHTVGLGESSDPNSVMYEYLTPGTVRRTFTDSNLSLINTDADRFMKVEPAALPPLPSWTAVAEGDGGAGLALLPNRQPPTSSLLGPTVANPLAVPLTPNRAFFPATEQPLPDRRDSILTGSGGNPVLIGGDGDDLLIGGAGRDLLVGGIACNPPRGADSDQISGTNTTATGHHDLALQALVAEWAAAEDVQDGNGAWLDGSHFRKDDWTAGNAARDLLPGGLDVDGFLTRDS
jgi:probable HAF family extracellular repeat protein